MFSMGNICHFDLLPPHILISILIFMYLLNDLAFKKHSGTHKTISLDFTTVMPFYRLCKATTINMVSTVR